jgi:hypothetical protein
MPSNGIGVSVTFGHEQEAEEDAKYVACFAFVIGVPEHNTSKTCACDRPTDEYLVSFRSILTFNHTKIAKQAKYGATGASHDEMWTHLQNEVRSPCTG